VRHQRGGRDAELDRARVEELSRKVGVIGDVQQQLGSDSAANLRRRYERSIDRAMRSASDE
jgi:hypothetical protein